MRSAGIDIGSRTVKLVIVENGEVTHRAFAENSFSPIEVCRGILDGQHYDRIMATGYGRHLFGDAFGAETISEIKAFALGVRRLCPSARTVLDIGGQDVKAISLDERGRMGKFEMNDKCAAGTGRFLEIMAMALGCSLAEFAELGASAANAETINSMCTVFAESEVVSSVARGAPRDEIARGIHEAVVRRTINMLKRVGINDDLVFVGGVAQNRFMGELLRSELQREVVVPEMPQLAGALGCALAAEEG